MLREFHRIHQFLSQPRTWLTALAGTGAMEAFLRLAPKARLPRIDYFTSNGTLFARPGPKATVAGAAVMYMGAVGWVTLFRLIRSRKSKGGSPALAGLAFGSAVFLFSSLVVFPSMSLIHPLIRQGKMKNPGFFGLGLNGWRTALVNFMAHGVFGLIVGVSENMSPQSRSFFQHRHDHLRSGSPSLIFNYAKNPGAKSTGANPAKENPS